MIIIQKMQDAVNQKSIDCLLQGFPLTPGFITSRVNGNHHVSQHFGLHIGQRSSRHGKSDDVGRTLPVEVLRIEFCHTGIIREDNAQFLIMTIQVV